MCSNAMFCSTDICCSDYQSNDKAGHSGKTMSAGVRKRKWHKLCERLFTIFLFQKLREAGCKHRALHGNSKFCILLKLSWFKALNKRRTLVKK